jgi:hypothetical protein
LFIGLLKFVLHLNVVVEKPLILLFAQEILNFLVQFGRLDLRRVILDLIHELWPVFVAFQDVSFHKVKVL